MAKDGGKVYRGESRKYSEDEANPYKFTPSIYRENRTDNIHNLIRGAYNKYRDILKFDDISKKANDTENAITKRKIRTLGIMQHYGLQSPLLDVSTNEKVAKYFACNKHFGEKGYVYSFDVSSMSGIDTTTVKNRMNIMWDNNTVDHITVTNKSYCFDYASLFCSSFNNIRYQRQSGRFILHHYKKENETFVPCFLDSSNVIETVIVEPKDKLITLLELALKSDVTECYLFPDKDSSVKLYVDYYRRSRFIGQTEKDIFSCVDESIVEELCNSFNGYVFLMTSLKDYLQSQTATEENRIEQLKMISNYMKEL